MSFGTEELVKKIVFKTPVTDFYLLLKNSYGKKSS